MKAVKVSGKVHLEKAGKEFLGVSRIDLLEKTRDLGSISRAARAVGISYKTAWEQIETMNNLADRPLVVRTSGGRGGGGTELTDAGHALVRRFRALQQEHARFLSALDQVPEGSSDVFQLLRRIGMKVSARNLWAGTVKSVTPGAVNDLVILELSGGARIAAVVTRESVEALGLIAGTEAFAMVKSSSVIIARELGAARLSARNILCGQVVRFTEGAVNSEVTLQLSGGNTVSATITLESARNLELREGVEACAVIKSSCVIVGVH